MVVSNVDRILTRHFLRRFLENDLISPDADRLQLLVVVGAGLMSATLFISVFMSFNYVGIPYTPGQLAVAGLEDRFFYLALSMVVLALVAVTQWDALVVDIRDASILEPLPIPALTIRRAKLTAVAILGAAVALAVNALPSVIFPWLFVYHTRISVASMLLLNVSHLVMTFAAGAFAYLAIIAFRETLATLLPGRLFALISPWVQGGLIVLLGTALLMVPPASSDVERRGFEGTRALLPPTWFLGAYEAAVGGIIADSRRSVLSPRRARADATMTAAYNEHRARFRVLGARAAVALGGVLAVTGLVYLWNFRRFSALTPPAAPPMRRRWRLATAVARAVIVRDPTARAGFFFTIAALWRSNVHRLTIACAGAAGLAMSLIALSGISLTEAARTGFLPTRLLAVQPLLFGILLVAFRHAIRVPVDLRAGWGFQLAWRERERQFLSGARRAALVTLVVPALAAMFPLFAYAMGPQLALMHAALGFAGAVVLLEILLVGYDKVPFTCTYLPNENMKAVGPILTIAFLIGATTFAGMQSAALADAGTAVRLLILLALIFGGVRVAAVRMRRPELVDFNEAPATTQRLGLHT